MRPILPAALLAAVAASPALAGSDPPRPLPAEPPHTAAITPEELLWTDAWLADDARAGREAGTPECAEAAKWIAGRMTAMGLEAPEKAPDRLQRWDLPGGIAVPEDCALSVLREGADRATLESGKDYVVMGGSGAGDVEAPVVFAGYGIKAPEFKYDDFAGLDCAGKVVVVLRHEPREKDKDSRWNGDRMTRHSFFPFKVQNARAAGAAALVLVNDLGNHEEDRVAAAPLGIPGDAGIPVALAGRAFGAALLAGTGLTQAGLQKAVDDGDAPASREIPGVRVRLKAAVRKQPTENVAGILRGSDPKLRDEWVVVGAHYDHVGKGQAGGLDPRRHGEIHNGADDNASGTAAMLEVAEHFALGEGRPRRSLLFLAFSGEEKGLLGSAFYVKEPLVPLDRVAAMVNLDMVGRYRPGQFDVVGADSGSTLREIATRANEGVGLELRFTNSGMANSDGFNFYNAKVPTLFLFTGLHDQYHRPDDDWWLFDAAGAAKVATLAARITRALADADGRPAYKALNAAEFSMNRRNRVALGVEPEAADGKGAGLKGVSTGSPAEAAGLRAGDRIVSLAGKEVRGPEDLRAALNYVRPGDEIAVRAVRGEETLDFRVQFPGPPGPVFGISWAQQDDGGRGALVEEVTKGTVAEASGLRPGDRILSFAGREVPGGTSLAAALRLAKAGETAEVKILRDGKELTLKAAFPK